MKMKTSVLAIFLFLSAAVFPQAETHAWKSKNVSYKIPIAEKKSNGNASGFLNVLKKGYKLFISDYDGDNCPFTPSCSEFFTEAVRLTNPATGFLMFADRFTRDLNYFNRNEYPRYRNGKLFDPPEKYKL